MNLNQFRSRTLSISEKLNIGVEKSICTASDETPGNCNARRKLAADCMPGT